MRIPKRSVGMATALVAALGVVSFAAPASASDLQTKLLVSNCYVCHGPAGKSAGQTPRLNNQTAAKVQESLTMFAKGDKPSTIMGRIAKGYSAAQIKAMAAHIGSMNKSQ